MIYVRLYGGLGNQLFQYASARAASLRRGVALGIDRRHLGRDRVNHAYGLNHFGIVAEAQPADLPPHRRERPIAYALWRLGLWQGPRFLREKGLGLNPLLRDAPDRSYLHGYFQTEKYFSGHEAVLRDELRIVTPPTAENAKWIERIGADTRAVSVHLRRGDYLQGSKEQGTHASCDETYYRQALALIAAESGLEPRAYVFSDDPVWARENLALGVETVILGHNDILAAHEDLRLMSLCRHHVIANSTFSWWGAWLGGGEGSVTVAPKRWFSTDRLSNPDILPERWVSL